VGAVQQKQSLLLCNNPSFAAQPVLKPEIVVSSHPVNPDSRKRTRGVQGSILQNSISAISFFILKFSPTVTYII
jgi:hypothetical protein